MVKSFTLGKCHNSLSDVNNKELSHLYKAEIWWMFWCLCDSKDDIKKSEVASKPKMAYRWTMFHLFPNFLPL